MRYKEQFNGNRNPPQAMRKVVRSFGQLACPPCFIFWRERLDITKKESPDFVCLA
jgi:hypothetical protein